MYYLKHLKNHKLIQDADFIAFIKKYNPKFTYSRKIVDGEEFGVETPYESVMVTLPFPSPINTIMFFISSFPGNCSSIVVDNIQQYQQGDSIDDRMKIIVDFCEELSKLFGYASIFMSTTIKNVVTVLNERGYNLINTNTNPHSGHKNYFLVYNI